MRNTQIRIKIRMGGKNLSEGSIILSEKEFDIIAHNQRWSRKTLNETLEVANRDYKYLEPKESILIG